MMFASLTDSSAPLDKFVGLLFHSPIRNWDRITPQACMARVRMLFDTIILNNDFYLAIVDDLTIISGL